MWCIKQGHDPQVWVIGLSVGHFFTFVVLELILPRNPRFNLFRDRQSLNDMGFNIITGAIRPFLAGLLTLIIVWFNEFRIGSDIATLWPSSLPFAAQVLLAILCASFMDYWVHRAYHTVDRLWWFHALHHSATQMHILKGGRMHIMDEVAHALTTPLPMLLLGAPTEVLLMSSLWGVFTGNAVHSNVDQRFPSWAHYFLPTVQLHNLHHSTERRYQDSNYSGTTPLWDWLFGTLSHPHHCELKDMGLKEHYMPDNFLKQILFPFKWQLKPPIQTTPDIIDT